MNHLSLKNYLLGFFLALSLTLISFGLAILENVSRQIIVVGLYVAALAQIFVHLRFFLHLDSSSEQRWNLFTIIITALLSFILICGGIWVMYTLNSRMM
jgi:cytochrome o ubiquinol oxidase subunit IV